MTGPWTLTKIVGVEAFSLAIWKTRNIDEVTIGTYLSELSLFSITQWENNWLRVSHLIAVCAQKCLMAWQARVADNKQTVDRITRTLTYQNHLQIVRSRLLNDMASIKCIIIANRFCYLIRSYMESFSTNETSELMTNCFSHLCKQWLKILAQHTLQRLLEAFWDVYWLFVYLHMLHLPLAT